MNLKNSGNDFGIFIYLGPRPISEFGVQHAIDVIQWLKGVGKGIGEKREGHASIGSCCRGFTNFWFV